MHHNEARPVNYDGGWSSMKVQNQVRVLLRLALRPFVKNQVRVLLRLALRPFVKSNNDGTPHVGY